MMIDCTLNQWNVHTKIQYFAWCSAMFYFQSKKDIFQPCRIISCHKVFTAGFFGLTKKHLKPHPNLAVNFPSSTQILVQYMVSYFPNIKCRGYIGQFSPTYNWYWSNIAKLVFSNIGDTIFSQYCTNICHHCSGFPIISELNNTLYPDIATKMSATDKKYVNLLICLWKCCNF